MDFLKWIEEKSDKGNLIPSLISILLAVFLIILGQFFIPSVREFLRGVYLFLLPALIFSLAGFMLFFLTTKKKQKGTLEKFLMLTGASAGLFFPSIVLHNIIYGLFVFLFGSDFWHKLGTGDEFVFFIMAVLVCPIGFLIGTIGSITLFLKKK